MLYPWPPPHLCQAPPDQVCSSAKVLIANFQGQWMNKAKELSQNPCQSQFSKQGFVQLSCCYNLLHVEGLWWLLFPGGHIDFAFLCLTDFPESHFLEFLQFLILRRFQIHPIPTAIRCYFLPCPFFSRALNSSLKWSWSRAISSSMTAPVNRQTIPRPLYRFFLHPRWYRISINYLRKLTVSNCVISRHLSQKRSPTNQLNENEVWILCSSYAHITENHWNSWIMKIQLSNWKASQTNLHQTITSADQAPAHSHWARHRT